MLIEAFSLSNIMGSSFSFGLSATLLVRWKVFERFLPNYSRSVFCFANILDRSEGLVFLANLLFRMRSLSPNIFRWPPLASLGKVIYFFAFFVVPSSLLATTTSLFARFILSRARTWFSLMPPRICLVWASLWKVSVCLGQRGSGSPFIMATASW